MCYVLVTLGEGEMANQYEIISIHFIPNTLTSVTGIAYEEIKMQIADVSTRYTN